MHVSLYHSKQKLTSSFVFYTLLTLWYGLCRTQWKSSGQKSNFSRKFKLGKCDLLYTFQFIQTEMFAMIIFSIIEYTKKGKSEWERERQRELKMKFFQALRLWMNDFILRISFRKFRGKQKCSWDVVIHTAVRHINSNSIKSSIKFLWLRYFNSKCFLSLSLTRHLSFICIRIS